IPIPFTRKWIRSSTPLVERSRYKNSRSKWRPDTERRASHIKHSPHARSGRRRWNRNRWHNELPFRRFSPPSLFSTTRTSLASRKFRHQLFWGRIPLLVATHQREAFRLARSNRQSFMISFIVPAHNEQAVIGRTLAAINDSARVLGKPFEIIVANDASTDSTA